MNGRSAGSVNRWALVFIVFLFVPLLTSCTKEKAEALKVAADKLKDEFSFAMAKLLELTKLEIATYFPEDDIYQQLLGDAKSGKFNDAKLQQFILDSKIDEKRNRALEIEIGKLRARAVVATSTFDNLAAGHFFAQNAVQPAMKHFANLTVEIASFARFVARNPRIGQDARQRAKLVDQIEDTYKVSDQATRERLLKALAGQIQDLIVSERSHREALFIALARAQLASKTVTELIRDYDRLDVSDVLSIVREGVTLGSALSGGNASVTDLLARLDNGEKQLRDDPLIAPLLDVSIK